MLEVVVSQKDSVGIGFQTRQRGRFVTERIRSRGLLIHV